MNINQLPPEKLVGLLKDPKFYLENFTKVKTKLGGLVPFVLNEVQKDIFNALRESTRIIVLKCRQIGCSTGIAGFFYHDTIINPGTTTALIGYNSDLTAEFLDMVKTFYRTTPEEIRPTLHYNSKYEISFPKLDSKILVLPSTENAGRGYTIHNCLASEVSSWKDAEEKMSTLEASVPIGGRMIVEATPKEIGHLFHRMWVSDNNGYIKKEYGWWWAYSLEEISIIEQRMNNPMKFAREFGLMFSSSGRSVFDQGVIMAHRKNILKVGDEWPVGSGKFVREEDGLRVYKDPEPDGIYCIGADVSEGVEGGDYSVATIFDRRNGEEVAMYRYLVPADRLGVLLDKWGRKYNNALLVVEINNHGLTTVAALKNLLYPSLYFRPARFETTGMPVSDKIGWKTTRLTRPLMIDDLAQVMREGVLTIHSRETLDEMMVFIYDDNGEMACQSGFYDDCLFSAAIANQGFKILFSSSPTQLGEDSYSHLGL